MTNNEIMQQNLVSVIIPVYNGEKFLEQAIQSVVNQTYSNTELIIVDDGSTDQSLLIAKKFESKNVRVFTQLNSGGCVARNLGIEKAKGEYIKFLDADDFLYPDALTRQVEIMQGCHANEIIFGDFNFVDEKGNLFSVNKFDKSELLASEPESFFLSNWEILISCPLHRKSILSVINGFDPILKSGQESDLHFRLALIGILFTYFPDTIFAYRTHKSEKRISVSRMIKIPEFEQINYRYQKFYNALKEKNEKLTSFQQNWFEKSYFSMARKYFIANRESEGKLLLLKAKGFSTYNIPAFKGRKYLGVLYYVFGSVIGFHCLETVIASFVIKKTKSKDSLSRVLETE